MGDPRDREEEKLARKDRRGQIDLMNVSALPKRVF